ncbi:uncharacterized protein LOC128234019 isoform X2 [Mya arenaria]|uniref:uncharacterized protein LOC128234019 isoform X2 n=1 Tax=Mya arenaria TaxID=6604 RepID=UPI0022E2DCA1|nr:uncharacterized protein LOC128234019 isoform X2 [Mya arenaria]
MATFFTFGILLAFSRSECFELSVNQDPNPAYEHDHVTLSARYSGFEEIEHPTRVVWSIISPLHSVGRILLPGCTVFGPIDNSAYNFTCSEDEFTWTILNVSRSQQGQIWSCTLATNVSADHAELALKLHVEVSSVQLIKPVEIEVRETEKSRVLFECVSDGLPAPTIRWFMDNKTPNNTDDEEELKLNSSSIISEIVQNADNTYHVKSQLHFTVDRKYDGMEIYCTANNTARVLISTRRPVIRVQYSQLFIENPVNCGEPAILRCRSSSATTSIWNFKLNGNSIVSSTTIDFNTVYSESTDLDGTITLVVRNTSVHDRGSYTCQISSYPESQPVGLEFECKPKALEINVTVDAKLHFVIDNVYPIPTELVVTVFSQFKEEFTCGYVSCKQNNEGYHNCVWNSNRYFRRGTYTYVVNMQFITKADSLAGSFTIDTNSSNESLTLETSHMVQDSEPDINLTCTYTGNRTVYVVSWYRNRALVGAVCPSCAILIPPHFDRYQFICPSTFETVLSVEQLILNQTLDMWMCQVGFGFGDVLESSPVDILLKGLVTEGPEQPVSISEKVKLIGGVIGGFVTGLLVGIASVFLVHKMRLVGKCMAEKETTDIPAKLAAAHQQESLPYENDKEQDIKTNPSEGVVCYQNTMGTAGSDQTAGNTKPYESLQERNQEEYDVILQY